MGHGRGDPPAYVDTVGFPFGGLGAGLQEPAAGEKFQGLSAYLLILCGLPHESDVPRGRLSTHDRRI